MNEQRKNEPGKYATKPSDAKEHPATKALDSAKSTGDAPAGSAPSMPARKPSAGADAKPTQAKT